MQDSIFTKIIKGMVPCHKVYEDDKTLAFMDIHPIQPGHVLLVSKNPAETVYDLPDDDYRAIWEAARKIADKIKQVFPEKKRVGIMVEGLDVPHAHIKIFPINTGTEFRNEPDLDAEPDHTVLTEMANRLRF